MSLYGTEGQYVYDPLSYLSAIIESRIAADDWNKRLYIFLDECEKSLEKSKEYTESGLKMVHKKEIIDIGLRTGFIDLKKAIIKAAEKKAA